MSLVQLHVGGYTSLVPGVLFMVIGVAMNRRLRMCFESFYLENKCTLWFSTIGLSVPLLFRAFLNLMRAYRLGWIGNWD